MSDFAQEAGRWYRLDGAPCYSIVGANGNERPTTLRDARKLGLVPSVTTIIRQAAAPALERWKQQQILLAAATLPIQPGETADAWIKRIEKDSQEQAKQARERGTAIHAAIEKHYRRETPDEELWDWIKLVSRAIQDECGDENWRPERSFASELGYGGKIDLHSERWVLDFKGVEDVAAANIYDEHRMQLGAYTRAIAPAASQAVVFIGRRVPSVRIMRLSEEDCERGFQMFKSLLDYWKAKHGIQ